MQTDTRARPHRRNDATVRTVQAVLVHADFGTIEHRRLVHIVPDEQIGRGAFIVVERELLRPDCAQNIIKGG